MTSIATETLIEMENVSKEYGSKLAVENLSLQVSAGEVFAFLGPNGAGKTTSIKLITGLLRPTLGMFVSRATTWRATRWKRVVKSASSPIRPTSTRN